MQHETIQIALTADGSPTARLGSSLESMHSEDGALGETRFIYQPAVEQVWERGWPAHFISVGLGLGYNELLIAQGALGDSWSAVSYEADPVLRDSFLRWVCGETTDLAETYDTIAAAFGGEPTRLRLQKAWEEKRWEVCGALRADTAIAIPASAILFDAFSRATCPELWTESFLSVFLAKAAASKSLFVTYAATASLKRVLQAAGFVLETRRGFGRKRESTFASRGA